MNIFQFTIIGKKNIIHFILTAEKETIKSRINADESRDKNFSLEFLEFNQNFLIDNFKDAKYINTENKDVNEVAKEILSYL